MENSPNNLVSLRDFKKIKETGGKLYSGLQQARRIKANTKDSLPAFKQNLKRNITRRVLNTHGRKIAQLNKAPVINIKKNVDRAYDDTLSYIKQNEAFKELNKIYGDVTNDLDHRAFLAMNDTPPKKPKFPWAMLTLAIVKDILDIFTAGGVSIILSIVFGIVLLVWMFGKIKVYQKALVRGGVVAGKKLMLYIIKRLIAWGIIDSVPLIAGFPFSTLFVLLAHYRHTKTVKLIFRILKAWKSGELKAVMEEGRRLEKFVETAVEKIQKFRVAA